MDEDLFTETKCSVSDLRQHFPIIVDFLFSHAAYNDQSKTRLTLRS